MWLYTVIIFIVITIVMVVFTFVISSENKYSIREIITLIVVILSMNILLIISGYSWGVSEGVKRTYVYMQKGNLKLQRGDIAEIDTLFTKDLHIPLLDKDSKFIIKYYKKGGRENVERKANRPESKNE